LLWWVALSRIVTRFAPSPNGFLHAGHALSAMIAAETARENAGRFLLRIEDIDTTRARPEFTATIFEDLKWLGLTWEEPVMIQSQHFPAYLAAADKLISQGLLYPCFASRSEIDAASDPNNRDPDGAPLYPGLWRSASADIIKERMDRGESPALRLDMAAAMVATKKKHGGQPLTFVEIDEEGRSHTIEAAPERWGDAVIVRKDVPASYHLAVVVDDARQGVTHVTRGQDLFHATSLHRLLQDLLGLPTPIYAHHRLIRWADGRKLSKSSGDMGLKSLREEGATAADILKALDIQPVRLPAVATA
jgi:glutamyl-Q tRNA(Asp) synthetase